MIISEQSCNKQKHAPPAKAQLQSHWQKDSEKPQSAAQKLAPVPSDSVTHWLMLLATLGIPQSSFTWDTISRIPAKRHCSQNYTSPCLPEQLRADCAGQSLGGENIVVLSHSSHSLVLCSWVQEVDLVDRQRPVGLRNWPVQLNTKLFGPQF